MVRVRPYPWDGRWLNGTVNTAPLSDQELVQGRCPIRAEFRYLGTLAFLRAVRAYRHGYDNGNRNHLHLEYVHIYVEDSERKPWGANQAYYV